MRTFQSNSCPTNVPRRHSKHRPSPVQTQRACPGSTKYKVRQRYSERGRVEFCFNSFDFFRALVVNSVAKEIRNAIAAEKRGASRARFLLETSSPSETYLSSTFEGWVHQQTSNKDLSDHRECEGRLRTPRYSSRLN